MIRVILLLGIYFTSCTLIKAQDDLIVDYSSIFRNIEEQVEPGIETRKLVISSEKSSFVKVLDSKEDKYWGNLTYSVLKKKTTNQLVYKYYIGTDPFYYEEPMPVFNWDFLEGDTLICDYSCQKAKTEYRGRTWIVWYTLELPYSDGPWKLCGLPGLILKAEDSKKDFSFVAFKIGKGNFDEKISKTSGFLKTTFKEFVENKQLYDKEIGRAHV